MLIKTLVVGVAPTKKENVFQDAQRVEKRRPYLIPRFKAWVS